MSNILDRSTERTLVLTHAALRTSWFCVRYCVVSILLIAETVVTTFLTVLALGGFATIVLFKLLANVPTFPTWEMLSFSITAALLVLGYRGLIYLLLGDERA